MTEVRDPMPKPGRGWHVIDGGPGLEMMFSPDRSLTGGASDHVLRKTIDVALAGTGLQSLRFDPFSEGAHYHVRPARGRPQIPLEVKEGQTPLEAALAFFDEPRRFRELLAGAEDPETAAQITDAQLAHAAKQIRAIDARPAA